MKLKSELYIEELCMMLHGLNLQVQDCVNILKREKVKAQIASFLVPWQSDSIWMALAVKADMLAQHVSAIQGLREKIMLSEGVDSDMLPITLEKILENDQAQSSSIN
jgi:hypothetical protein